MTTKIILDVDTGTDDAVALMVAALSPDIELVGATTVNGNTAVHNCTENTLRVFDWIGLPATAGGSLALDTATISILGWDRDAPAIRRWNDGIDLD